MIGDKERLTAQRDHWIRCFNQIEHSITHHKNATATMTTDADDALYRARDRVLRQSAAESVAS